MKCCVPNCNNYSDRRSDASHGVSFHRLPADKDLKEKWINKINRPGWTPSKFTRICSKHFRSTDYTETEKGIKKLDPDVVPSLFLQHLLVEIKSPLPILSSLQPQPSSSTFNEILVLNEPPEQTKLKQQNARLRSKLKLNRLKIRGLQMKLLRLKRKSHIFCEKSTLKMKCCVPYCKNDSRHISKSQGITFHVFPVEPSLRKSWLKALGKESWEPKERSAVCSEHFLSEDLYETQNGLRRVKVGAVPFIVQNSSNRDHGEPATLKACRICLVMNAKLISIRNYKLKQAYENLTGISIGEEDKLPQKLCVECVQRLINCSRFRLKSLRANSLMLEVMKKQDCLTDQNITSINRFNNQLTSPITPKHYEPNHFDEYIECYHDEPLITHETIPSTCNVDIKKENEIFLTEVNQAGIDDEFIKEEKNDDGVDESAANEDENTDLFNDKDDISEKEYVLCDKDEYSSDNSLPLEECKIKESRKRKENDENTVKSVKRVKKINEPVEPKIERSENEDDHRYLV